MKLLAVRLCPGELVKGGGTFCKNKETAGEESWQERGAGTRPLNNIFFSNQSCAIYLLHVRCLTVGNSHETGSIL